MTEQLHEEGFRQSRHGFKRVLPQEDRRHGCHGQGLIKRILAMGDEHCHDEGHVKRILAMGDKPRHGHGPVAGILAMEDDMCGTQCPKTEPCNRTYHRDPTTSRFMPRGHESKAKRQKRYDILGDR